MRLLVLSLSLFFITASYSTSDYYFPVISTGYGSIRGYAFTAHDGTEARIFKKIPFASAPIGDLRWRKPQPHKPWNGRTLDGTFFGPACAQRTNKYDGPVTGFSEDCLHVNVYTSERCRESNSTCPVVFIIHGGAGLYESTMKFPDETLVRNFVSQGIVVVTTAYRLSAFGAMDLGDENALPANLGLHDILAALNFTRNEIGHFGGSNEKITLLGQSEGGHYALMIAFSPGISKPGEKRLIDGVIVMSGNGGLEFREKAVERSHSVAKELNCTGTAREIVECMRLLDIESIVAASYKVNGPHILSQKAPFGITMSGELFPITNEKELREDPNPIRLMIGTTIEEIGGGVAGVDKINRILGIENGEECYDKYLNDVESGAFNPGYIEASQEMIMTAHIYAKYVAQIGGEAYLYEYDYPVHGGHTDDAYHVLGIHEYEMDENERWLSRAYPRYFSNFVKGERLAKDWSKVTPLLMNYYSVNRSRTDGVFPHTKYGYQNNLVKYYDELVKYDQVLSAAKMQAANAPVEYKSLNFDAGFQGFLESLSIVDAIIFVCVVLGALSLLCCLCNCFTSLCCCCCRGGYSSI